MGEVIKVARPARRRLAGYGTVIAGVAVGLVAGHWVAAGPPRAGQVAGALAVGFAGLVGAAKQASP
jgi:hypothetical protein